MGYVYDPLSVPGAVSNLSGSAGVGFRLPLLSWLTLRAIASGGYYFAIVNGEGGGSAGNAFFGAGLGVNFSIGPSFVLGVGASYRLYMNLLQTIDLSVGVMYNLFPTVAATSVVSPEQPPAKPLPAQPVPAKPVPLKNEPQKPVEQQNSGLVISNLTFENVFPIFHTYYDDHPIGKLTLKNTESSSATNVSVSLFIRQHMDAPKKCVSIPEIKAGEERSVDLYALFSQKILDITEPTKVAAEISVTYTLNGKSLPLTDVETLRIYDRNAMMWDDNRKAAAFVTAKEPTVLIFSNNVNAWVKGKLNRAVDQNLQTAIALHDALRLYGISYVSNPLTSYAVVSQNKLAIDTLKFPRQTFEYRSGDCSDLTLLYCALMESVQIETAFITIPGHIFMAFALKATPDEARTSFSHPDELIFRNDKVWVPVEVTERAGTLLTAWQQGAKEWRENLSKNQADFYPVHDAWKIYEPVGLPGSGTALQMPDAARVFQDYKSEVSRYIELEIYARVAQLQAAITKSNESPKSVNALGVLYARYDLVEKAEIEFKRALGKTEYVPALVNLGHLSFLKQDMEQALIFYQRAYKKAPQEPTVLLGLARASQELEDYRTVRKSYDELKKVSPALAQQFAYLELRGEESTRAASISGAKEMMVWNEN